MTEIKSAKSLKDIDVCGQFSPDMSILMAGGDANDPSTYQPKFINAQSAGRIDAKRMWAPSLEDLNQFVPALKRLGYKSVCKMGGEETGKNMFVVSKGTSVPAGIFGACDPIGAAQRKQLPMVLTPEAAKYLADKFPALADGCSSVKGTGEIYYKVLADAGSLGIAMNGIREDIRTGKLPSGVDKKIAEEFVGFLQEVAEQDPIIVQKAAMEKQLGAMKLQLGVTVVLQIATTGVFAGFFLKQIKLAQRTLDQMGEQLGNVKWDEVARDMVEVERQKMAESPSAEIRGRDAEALEYLRRIARPRRGHTFLVGPSGSGKDTIVRRAAQLLAKRDPRVLAERTIAKLVGKPLWYIDPTLLQAKGGVVGSGAKVMKLVRAVLVKGEPVYWPELAQGLTAFAHSKGSSESPAVLLKTILDEVPRGFSGSAVPDDYRTMAESGLMGDPKQFERRVPPTRVKPLPIEQVVEIIRTHTAPAIAGDYGITIEPAVLDRIIEKTQTAMNGGAESGALFDKIESILMDILDRAQKRNMTSLTMEHVDAVFGDPEFIAGLRNGKGGATADATPPDSAVLVHDAQVKALQEFITRHPSFMGEDPTSILKLAEIAYEKLSKMSPAERSALVSDPAEFGGRLAQWLDEEKAKTGKGGGGDGGGGDPPPPPAPAGGPPPAPAPAGSGGGVTRSSLVVPWTAVTPSPVTIDAASQIFPDVGAVLDRIPQFVPARAVTPEGIVMNAMMEPPAMQAPPSAGVRGSVTLPPGAVNLGGSEMFAPSAALGVAGGAGGLVVTEALAAMMGREHLPWYMEFPAFVGTGMGISAAHAAAGGAAVTAGGMLAGLAHGLPSCLIIFGATGKYLTDTGLDIGGRAHKYTTVLGGSVLAAAAVNAELVAGGATVAELGLTTMGFAVGAGAAIGVGSALLAGGAAGHYALDKGAAKMLGIKAADGDSSLSGWYADEAANLTPRSAQMMIHDIAAWF